VGGLVLVVCESYETIVFVKGSFVDATECPLARPFQAATYAAAAWKAKIEESSGGIKYLDTI